MTPARRTLTSLKTTDLKHLAYVTGLNAGGIKAQLTAALTSELGVSRLADARHVGVTPRLLSIDMGIRNLAYCVLDMPGGLDFLREQRNAGVGLAGEGKEIQDVEKVEEKMKKTNVLKHLKVAAWERVVVNELQPLSSSTPTITSSVADIPSLVTSARPPPPAETSAITETTTTAFEPIAYAKLAYQLVTHLLSTYRPTTIIIERQRWRSGGASSVLEWTIRVNMFEGMIHAAFETLGGQWRARQLEITQRRQLEGTGGDADVLASLKQYPDVYSVSPKRVFDFWDDRVRVSASASASEAAATPDSDTPSEVASKSVVKRAGSKTKAQKQLKIGIVQDWLQPQTKAEDTTLLECTGRAGLIRQAFMEKLTKTKGRATSKTKANLNDQDDVEEAVPAKNIASTVQKLDDLADCLLQGVTWVQWEANRHAALEEIELTPEKQLGIPAIGAESSSRISRRTTKKLPADATKKAAKHLPKKATKNATSTTPDMARDARASTNIAE